MLNVYLVVCVELSIHFYEGLSTTSFLRVHVLSRVESITEDYVESNCSMTAQWKSTGDFSCL